MIERAQATKERINGALSAAKRRHAGWVNRNLENLAKCSATVMAALWK
jgi:hypothetical protein